MPQRSDVSRHRDSSAGIWSDETAYWRGMTYSPSSSEGGGDSRRADAVHERASKPEPRESRLSPSAGSRDDARIAASWYGARRIALPTHTPLQPGLSTPCRPVILHHGSLNMIYGILLDVALTRVVSA